MLLDQRSAQGTLLTACLAAVLLVGPAVVGLGQAAPGDPVEDDLPGWAPETVCGTTGQRLFDQCPRWSKRTADTVVSGGLEVAVTSDGATVLTAGFIGHEATLVAFDAVTGEERWRQTVPTPPSSESVPRFTRISLAEEEGLVVVAGNTEATDQAPVFATHAYAIETGELAWAAGTAGPSAPRQVATSLAVLPEDGMAVVGGGLLDGTVGIGSAVAALDLATGEMVWEHVVEASGDRVYPGGFEVAQAADSLAVAWAQLTEDLEVQPHVARLDVATGQTLWTRELTGHTFSGGAVVLAAEDGLFVETSIRPTEAFERNPMILKLDPATGQTVWETEIQVPGEDVLPLPIALDPAEANLLLPASSGEDVAVYQLDADTGQWVASARYGGPGAGPDDLEGASLSASGCLLMASRSPAGSQGGMWTVAVDASSLEVVGSAYHRDGPLNLEEGPKGVTAAPDGSGLYVTGVSDDGIGVTVGSLLDPLNAQDMLTVAYEDPCAGTL